jgi:4-hydroxybenzoyl-CoA thioesterase
MSGTGRDTPGFPRRFTVAERIRFQHCDPAGIAFFARLDELLNGAFEDWCEAVGIPFASMMFRQGLGFPLAHAHLDYTGVLQLGDAVQVHHHVRTVGNSSITFDVGIDRDGVPCLAGTHVRVLTSRETHRPVPLPDTLRTLLTDGPVA